MIQTESISIPAKDEFSLSSIILGRENTNPKGIIQFHAGTVIKKEFYLKMCMFFAEQGYHVVLFDYRGVGESRPASLKGFSASISDWGIKDATGIGDWIQTNYEGIPKYLIAHSMGGQIIGLMSNWEMYEKILVVASSSGNWNKFERKYSRKVKWSSRLLFPIILPLLGYGSGKFGLGEDWPKGVAEEWYQNCRENGLMAEYLSKRNQTSYYDVIDKDITAWFFSDDKMATRKTMPNFQKSYPNAKVDAYMIQPKSCNLEEIGHFGLFKEKSKDALWNEILFWLEGE